MADAEDEIDGFVVGDVVVLKAGGPAMTVTKVEANGAVKATWHDSAGKPITASFPAESLIRKTV